jgi:hypothetical protein
MRIKDKILQRKIHNGIISEENAKLFMDDAELIDGWWYSEKSPVYDKIEGAGDFISVLADALNFRKCNKCNERQEKLNKLLPFK